MTNPPSRESTYTRRFEDLAALRDRAALYASVLSVQVTDLEAGITALEDQIRLMLDNAADCAA